MIPRFTLAAALLSLGCAAPRSTSPVASGSAATDAHAGKGDGPEALDPPDGGPADAPDLADVAPNVADSSGPNDAPDAAADDVAPPAPAPLPACFTESAPLTLSGAGLPYAEASVSGATGWFLLDWASTGSTVDPSALSPSPSPGPDGRYAAFQWFGDWGDVWLATQDHSGIAAVVRQAGIIGTDFLSVHAYALDFGAARVHRAPGDCPLDATVWARLDAAGTFTDTPGQLPPGQPNVPGVPVRVAGATARAQLDTGFDDRAVPHAVNVNEAFFAQMDAARLHRAASLDLVLTTCTGVAEPVEAWRADGTLELVDDTGAAALALDAPVVFVKRTPASAAVCGGIGTWSTPGAQVGASVISAAGRVVFDPHAAAVFVPRAP